MKPNRSKETRESEIRRLSGLLGSGEIIRDHRLAVVEIDGLLQFMRLDTIPFLHHDGEMVERLLEDWTGQEDEGY